ncbi:hypothetical protein U9M48_005092 [Paspalum notatum var. saurae]|uniref:Uncharacterized protein n=1 Tax=Paspalum notatum var. saurae TaxID=547442 RepID=A0AAQ3PLL7_PASNO
MSYSAPDHPGHRGKRTAVDIRRAFLSANGENDAHRRRKPAAHFLGIWVPFAVAESEALIYGGQQR